ncbi:MAG: hypothetical protein JWM53_6128 [bacterium]|nr:hypothetical protein [bacterium]
MTKRPQRGVPRRAFLRNVGVAAAGALVLGVNPTRSRRLAPSTASASETAGAPKNSRAAATVPPAGAEVRALFGNLRPGTRLGPFHVVAVHGVHRGAIPVVLAAGERSFQVDVLRRGATCGIASSRSLTVFLANRGSGRNATDEQQGLGAMALAAALHRRELAGAPLPALLSFDERAQRHRGAIFDVVGA